MVAIVVEGDDDLWTNQDPGPSLFSGRKQVSNSVTVWGVQRRSAK